MESFLEEEAFELGFGEWRHLEEAEMESCREEGVPAEGSAGGRLEGEFFLFLLSTKCLHTMSLCLDCFFSSPFFQTLAHHY